MAFQPSSPQNPERVGAITPDPAQDYAAIMRYCQDERNWFKRARGEWNEHPDDTRIETETGS